MQDYSNSGALAMELLQSCTMPLMHYVSWVNGLILTHYQPILQYWNKWAQLNLLEIGLSNQILHDIWKLVISKAGYRSGPLFTKKKLSYGYRDPHDKPKTVWRPSQVYHGNPYTDKTASS